MTPNLSIDSHTFLTPVNLNFPDNTVIVSGDISSKHPITIIAKNILVFGDIVSDSELILRASENIYNLGKIDVNNLSIVCINLSNGCSDEILDLVNRLEGVKVSATNSQLNLFSTSRPLIPRVTQN